MKTLIIEITCLALVAILWAGRLPAQEVTQSQTEMFFVAQVHSDSNEPSILVKNLKLDFEFAGYGIYLPSDYPTITNIPLENGEIINFTNITEVEFTGKRIQWKKFIPVEKRSEYKNLDSQGYHQWSEIEVEISLVDRNNNRINARIKKPESTDIYLTGVTDRGEYKLKLNQENGKTVRVTFRPIVLLQCPMNSQHIYTEPGWNYCPIDGAKLKKVKPSEK